MIIRNCTIDKCQHPHRAKGMCAMHYQRFRKTGNVGSAQPKKPILGYHFLKCKIKGCDKEPRALGLCNNHYVQATYRGKPKRTRNKPSMYYGCKVDECERPHYAKQMCKTHYTRQWLGVSVDAPIVAKRDIMKTECLVSDCKGKHSAKGYCRKHYSRMRKSKTGEQE